MGHRSSATSATTTAGPISARTAEPPRRQRFSAALAEAREIPVDGLEPEQVITRDLLMLVSENQLAALEQKQYQLALDHMSGPQVWPAEMAQYQPADTPERLEKLLARYATYPELIEQNIGTLEEGVADGRTAAIMPVRRAIEQIDRLLAMAPADHPAASMAQVGDERPRSPRGRGRGARLSGHAAPARLSRADV